MVPLSDIDELGEPVRVFVELDDGLRLLLKLEEPV